MDVEIHARYHTVETIVEVESIHVEYGSCGSHRLYVKLQGDLGEIEKTLAEAVEHIKTERTRIEAEVTAELEALAARRATEN